MLETDRDPAPPASSAPDAGGWIEWIRGLPALARRAAGDVRRLGRVSLLAALATVMPPIGGVVLLGALPVLAPWLGERGELGVAIYCLGFIVLAGLAMLPTYAQMILAGMAFGFTTGAAAAMLGFLGASVLGYFVTTRLDGRRMMMLIEARPRWQSVYRGLLGSTPRRALWRVMLLRMAPLMPFAMLNVVLAGARVHPGAYLLGTWFGLAPRLLVVVYLAALVPGFDPEEGGSWLRLGIGGALSLLVLFVLGRLARRELHRCCQA